MNDPTLSKSDGYTIDHREHGVAIFGGVPLGEMSDLLEMFHDRWDYDRLDPGIAYAIDANVVATTERGSTEWREEIESRLEKRFDDPLERWVRGCNTGTSSLTIYSVLREVPLGTISRIGRSTTPADAADFGRCVLLLEVAPDDWRERLDEVADQHPAWRRIVEIWGELEDLLQKDRTDELRRRLEEVRS